VSDTENDKDIDEDALAALVRPSAAPAAESDSESSEDDDEDVLDLRALAASMAPPEPVSDDPSDDEDYDDDSDTDADVDAEEEAAAKSEKKAAAAKSTKKKSTKKKTSTKQKSDDEERARPAATVAEPEAKNNNMLIVVAVAAAAAVAIVYMVTQGDQTEPTGEVASAPPTSVQTPEDPEPLAAEDPVEETNPLAPEVEPAPVATGAEEEVAAIPAATGAGARRVPRGNGNRPTAMAEPAPTMEQAAASPTTMSTMNASAMEAPPTMGGLDSVLDMALGGRPAAGGTRTVANMQAAAPAMAAPSGDLPSTPSRGDVARTLGRLMSQIRQCAGDQVGLANATILVRSDGSPASVAIGGHPFGGTPQGACMEGVLRRAQFPPFRQNTFRVNYPFAIRATN